MLESNLEMSPGASIVDLTARTDKSLRKGRRDPKTVYALVLHQMACCFQPRDPLKRFLSLNSHFGILADGRILQLHPISALLWASNGFNARSVAVEFAGNFPSTRGVWWQGAKFGRNRPTQAQIDAGRRLIRHLIATMGLTHVLAHRQSSGTRTNDPGPDIWRNVGQWAVDRLGMRDGGAGFKIGSGSAIPAEWRTWSRPIAPEIASLAGGEAPHESEYDSESEYESAAETETELAHDVQTSRSPRYLRWVRDLHERTFPEQRSGGCSCSHSNGVAKTGGGVAPPSRIG